MLIHRFDPENLEAAYGIMCEKVYPGHAKLPVGVTSCLIEAQGSTRSHSHFEGEVFFIQDGTGEIEIDGERSRVGAGDAVYLPAFSTHVLRNLSDSVLRFVSIYWEGEEERLTSDLPERLFVTVAPPTPNGDLHLGHMAGPYLAADSYARAARRESIPTRLFSGSDDHQTYVVTKGRQLGMTPEAVTEHFAARNFATLEKAGIQFDTFLRPSRDEKYIRYVQAFFRKLYDAGKLETRNVDMLFCTACDQFLFEAFVKGGCPHCEEPTSGNGCEKCGRINDSVDLIEPRCQQCAGTPVRMPVKKLYFNLENYREVLTPFYSSVKMGQRLKSLTQRLLQDGLPNVSVSHPASWGIPVGIPGFEGQVIYEWLEMAGGYLYLAEESEGSIDAVWKQTGSRVVQFFGFDNGFFYTTFIPALLKAYDCEIRLPYALESNEFYQLEGKKFSTSRQHAVWADEVLNHVPADLMRYFLALTRPEVEETNFSETEFVSVTERELSTWYDWMAQVASRGYLGGEVSEMDAAFTSGAAFLRKLSAVRTALRASFGPAAFSLTEAAVRLGELVRVSKRFSSEIAHLTNEAERQEAIRLERLALKTLGLYCEPILPGLSHRILEVLGINPQERTWRTAVNQTPQVKQRSGFEFSEKRLLWRWRNSRRPGLSVATATN